MEIKNIINLLPRRGSNPKRLFTNTIVLHWDGVNYQTTGVDLARNIASYSIRTKSYAKTIQYHIRITKNGEILQCVDLDDRLYHANNLTINMSSISVCIEGCNPTQEQYNSLLEIMDYLKRRYKISRVTGHRDFVKTQCPGDMVYSWIDKLNIIQPIKAMKYNAGDEIKKANTSKNLIIRRDADGSSDDILSPSITSRDTMRVIGHVKRGWNGLDYIDVQQLERTGWVAQKYTKFFKAADKIEQEDNKMLLAQAINILNKIKNNL